MAENWQLGFVVDTAPLTNAAQAMDKLAGAAGRVASEEKARTTASAASAAATNNVTEATKQAAVQAERYLQSLKMEENAARAFKQSQEALNKAVLDGKVSQREYAELTKQVEDSLRRAQKAALDYRTAVNDPNGSNAAHQRFTDLAARARSATADISALQSLLAARGVGGLAGGLDTAAGLAGRLSGAIGATGVAAAGTAAGLAALGAVVFAGQKHLAEYQDRYQQLEARLANSLGSTAAAKSALDALRKSTQETGLGFDAAADALGRIARNNDAIGLTQQQMLQMVETVQKLGAVSGASMAEMQGGLIQFGQALASGRLQGDELRSIMENFPALAKAIAENFEAADGRIGVSIGTLRRMGSEGELTSQKIADAVLRATEKAQKEYDKLPGTMERANRKLADSFNKMLTDMGSYFGSSGFVQGVYTFLNNVTAKVGGIFAQGNEDQARSDRIAELREQIYGRTIRTRGGEQQIGGMAPGRARSIALGELRDLEQQQFEAAGARMAQDRDARLKKAIADSSSASDLVEDNLGQFGKDRKFRTGLRRFDAAIAAANDAIAMGGNEQKSVDDLKQDLSELRIARAQFIKNRNKQVAGLANDISGLARMNRDASNAMLAQQIGGGGGGTSIVMDAISARTADAGQARAGSLSAYIDANVAKRAREVEQEAAALARRTQEQRASNALIGQSAKVIEEQSIKQQIANFQFEKFGSLTGPRVTAAMEAYSKALRDNAKATNDAAAAQQAYNAEQDAKLQERLAGVAGDPRATARVRRDFENEQIAKNWKGSPEDLQRLMDARGRSAAAEDASQETLDARSDKARERGIQDTLRMSRLTTREYEIQARLVDKRLELERRGYSEGNDYYERRMAVEEDLARKEQAANLVAARNRRIIGVLEDAADKMEPLFKDTWDTVFEKGVGAAGDVFAKGMGKIIKDIGNQMVYEIALRPLQELLAGLLKIAAQSFLTSLFGSAIGGAFGGGGGMSDFGGGFAKGGVFNKGLTAFDRGGVFTNRVVNSPTLFAFSGGTGLMGEAGPEAIMPLKRGSDGKLGVYVAGGMGGDTTVVINDMRTSPTSAPVETKEERGSDGRRKLQIMVRDEVRRQVRGGELDKEMGASFGVKRTIQRR